MMLHFQEYKSQVYLTTATKFLCEAMPKSKYHFVN